MPNVMVTGGRGFLGKHVVKSLTEKGYHTYTLSKVGVDLKNSADVDLALRVTKPDIIVHLAAVCGGIGANQKEPGRFFYENLKMGIELIDAARRYGTSKFVQVGTVCSYPKYTPVPFSETELWNGYPEETNAPYGIAKKALLTMCQAYRQQYGMNAIYLIPVNLYGPGDNFNPDSSHVIPALIKKCLDAKHFGKDHIEVWGTGTASREFLYVEDCAEAIAAATEKYNGSDPVNIGAGSEITIKDLVDTIKKATGYLGHVEYDSTKPDGQPRRCLDTSRANNEFGFKASTPFEEGIKKTVEWYENTCSNF